MSAVPEGKAVGGEQTWPGVQESGRLVRLGAPSASGNEKLMECKHGEQAVLLPPGHVVFNVWRSVGRLVGRRCHQTTNKALGASI